MHDFKNIEYLKAGNDRQRQVYAALKKLKIFEIFETFSPLLVGTIPIDIDLPESDLDIICTCKNHEKFSSLLQKHFSHRTDFELYTYDRNGIKTTVSKFKSQNFIFEFFGQNIPTDEQNAYRHMIIEHKILLQKGSEFRAKIRQLKSEGLKTEPAFAQLLELHGNPYEALLKEKNYY